MCMCILSGISLVLVSCVEAFIHICSGCTGGIHICGILTDQKISQISFTAGLDTKLALKKVILKLLKICWRPSDRKLGFQPRRLDSPG